MTNNYDRWTPEEVTILKKYYPKGGYKACVNNGLDHRHRNSVEGKAHTIGVRNEASENERWTPKEISILKKYYYKGGVKACQKNGLNHKTQWSIISKAKRGVK